MDTRELLAKVRRIEIRTRRIVDELTGGAYRSVFKGRGIEFSEVRPYTPGDDVRDIDWNVTARTGEAFIKRYVEERELTVILAVDVSASCDFGTAGTLKRDKIAGLAALLAFSAIRNNDKVGLYLFSDRTELYLPPRSGKTHVLRVIRELVSDTLHHKGTDLANAMETLSRMLKRKAVIFVLSDCIDPAAGEKALKQLSRKHDVSLIQVWDPFERAVPQLPEIELEDAENGGIVCFDGAASSKHNLAEIRELDHQALCDLCRKSKTDLIEIGCREDPVPALMKFFHTRAVRGRR